MTTQFTQQVPYTFLLRLAPDNSYFILCPREVAVGSNKCMNFFGYGSFADYNSVMPHYMPPTPVDFSQFGASWCDESLTAYFNAISLSSYKKEFHYEGVVFQNNGNNLSPQGINNSLLVGRLEIYNQIDTDFDNLFSNLISTLNTLLTPISQISLSLLGINNIFPTLVHNLEALNENNVPVSIAQILKDKQINVDMSDTEISLDDTNLVNQLQNIYTILSSQNANQSAISSAINNKDNQSNIVDCLNFIFTEIYDNQRYSSLKPDLNVLSAITPSSNRTRYTYSGILVRLMSLLTSNKRYLASYFSDYANNSFRSNNQSLFESSSKSSFQNLQDISIKLQDIETKLEQNLPFATLTDVTLNVDTVKKCVTQEIKDNQEI